MNQWATSNLSRTKNAAFNLLKNQFLADLKVGLEKIQQLPKIHDQGLSDSEKLTRARDNLKSVETILTNVERRLSSFKKTIKLVEAVDALNALPDNSPKQRNAEKRVIKCFKDFHYSMLTLPEKALGAYKKFRDIVLRDIPDKLCQIIDRLFRKDTERGTQMTNFAAAAPAGTPTESIITKAKAQVQELRDAHAEHSNTGPKQ